MIKMALAVLLVLAIIFVVPIVVYAAFSAGTGLQPPGGSPVMFLAGVFVSKTGTAIAFVLLFYFARDSLSGRWVPILLKNSASRFRPQHSNVAEPLGATIYQFAHLD